MKAVLCAMAISFALTSSAIAQRRPPPSQPDLNRNASVGLRTSGNDYAAVTEPDRWYTEVSKNNRGTSTPIDHRQLVRLCGDRDGCSVRIGMHNWDDTGRVASREFLFFYNERTGAWRASLGDVAGADSNNILEHVNNSWSCYMTDGVARNWTNAGDGERGFGLLSWDQFNADCFLTLID